MIEGFWGFTAAYFGGDSSVAEDYYTIHQILDKKRGTHYEVAPLSWRLHTWLAINDERQLFNTSRTEENLCSKEKASP